MHDVWIIRREDEIVRTDERGDRVQRRNMTRQLELVVACDCCPGEGRLLEARVKSIKGTRGAAARKRH
jgi:hypothetical protein